MELKESIMTGITFVGDTVTEIASAIAEKNRLRVQLNHIKGVIRSDSATRDQAYIELGRFFYENLREGAAPENEAICAVIDAASERISTASVRYMELLNLQNETKIRSENAEKLKKIVAEKASASAKAAKEKGAELGQKAKEGAAVAVEKAKIAAGELKDKAAETVDEVRERFSPDRNADLEALIAEEQKKMQDAQEPAGETAAAEAPADGEPAAQAEPAAEESPVSFDF